MCVFLVLLARLETHGVLLWVKRSLPVCLLMFESRTRSLWYAGKRAKLWATFNEIGVAASCGFISGNHPPGKLLRFRVSLYLLIVTLYRMRRTQYMSLAITKLEPLIVKILSLFYHLLRAIYKWHHIVLVKPNAQQLPERSLAVKGNRSLLRWWIQTFEMTWFTCYLFQHNWRNGREGGLKLTQNKTAIVIVCCKLMHVETS